MGGRWFQVTVDPIVDEESGYAGAVHIVSDITDRKRAEEKLKAEKEWSEKLANYAPNIVIALRKRSKIAFFNRFAEELTGYKAEEVIGKEWIKTFIPEEQRDVIYRVWDDIVDNRLLNHHFENEIITKSGERRLIEWRNTIITENGEFRMVLSHGVDITERKQAEAERERLTAAIEQAGENIIITDPEGTIRYVNPAFEKLTGYTRKEVIGKTPRILKSGKQDEAFYRDLWETITSGRTWTGRMVNKRKDGSLYTEESTISPVRDRSGQTHNFVAVKRDITEYLRVTEEQASLREQLHLAQRLESVGRLAGGVAHDFNNMLNVILGYGEIVLDKLHPGDPLRDDVNAILEAGKRSAALTRQLLAFSRRQTLQPEVLDLNAVVRNLEKMLRRLIGEDISLELALAEEIDRVMADPGQVEQVIMNLSVNARDAMPNGGRLLFETADVELDETYAQSHTSVHPGKYVMLVVTDTGCGMDRETLSNVFEPFFTTKEKGKGTGLGLATVYGIVKQSGGHIWAYSEPGKGTTFKIFLPATETKPEPKTVVREKETAKGGGEHILVVEDEDSLRKLAETALSRLGYQVSVAANGGEALLLMEEKGLKPDLMVTDVVMPNMSGKDLANRLQRNQPDLRVLYMSGYTDNAIIHHGILEPGTDFIQKPFTLRDLAEKVQAILRGGHK